MPTLQEMAQEARRKTDEHLEWQRRQSEQLDDLLSETERRNAEETFSWVNGFNTVAAATTDANIPLGPPMPGTAWIVKLVAVTGGAAGPCAVYLDEIAPHNLCFFVTNAQIWTTQGELNLYVPQNRTLIFHFYNQVAAQKVTAAIQVRVLTEQPALAATGAGD